MGYYTSVQGIIKLKPSVVKKVRKIERKYKRNRYRGERENLFAKAFRHKNFYEYASIQRSGWLYQFKQHKNYVIINIEVKNYDGVIQAFFEKVLPKLSNEYKLFYRGEADYDNDFDEVYKVHEKNLDSLPFTIEQYYYEGRYGKNSSFKFINKPSSNITHYDFGDV